MNIKAMTAQISKVSGRSGLILKKHSPEILMVAGVVGIVGATILACRATLKVEQTLDVAKDKFDKIKEAKAMVDAGQEIDYDLTDYRKDMAVAYVQTGVDFVKLYGPAVTLGALSITCILGSHGIMRNRNIALAAAYKAVEESFNTYRRRVVEEYGVEKDFQFKTGIRPVTEDVVTIDENGKKVKSKETHNIVDPTGVSEYARFFDEASAHWGSNAEYNLFYVRCQQQSANDLLQARGHIFLNEVYDSLGIPRTRAGAIVGWVKGHGDDRVSFGIYDGKKPITRDFVNGYERSILLDFNVDGVIYDLI